MLKFPIYLDYSATTPVDPRVAAKMIPWLTEHFGNPASRSHAYGWEAEKAVEDAREQVAALVNADAKEIIWTSGATESNNLAIKGAAHFYQGKGKHIITVKTEHKAVLDTVRELEREGFEATYLDVQENGLIDLEALKAAIRPEFKKAMDSYETFFGEFVEFMQLLSDDPSNLTLMAKYADYMSQYTETMEALENIDESELTASELSYYIGVMSRIQQMVLAVAG